MGNVHSAVNFKLYSLIPRDYSRNVMWHYHLGGQQRGPVSDAELANLLQTGQINRNTPVWREGMADWQPLSAARPDGAPPLIAASGMALCVECGKPFPSDELVTLNNSLVCAQCKPLFLQRMAEGVPTSGRAGLWREGKKLVTRSETPFPDRCVKCNAPTNGFTLKRVLYWNHPAYYLLFLCSLPVLVIVLLIVRKKAVLHVGLCEAHRARRTRDIALCIAGILGGIALFVAAAIAESGLLVLAGIVALLFGIVWGVARAQVVSATKIDKEYVWVSGAGPAFLNDLPEH
jgi:hypothetical protein